MAEPRCSVERNADVGEGRVSHAVGLPAKIVAVHDALFAAGLSHGFGGALALAWCTGQARGTVDIDVNVFVPPDQAPAVVAALPGEVSSTEHDLDLLRQDGQARLWWDRTPIDLFLSTDRFHDEVATRLRWEDFGGHRLPFLSCSDLAVFKAFFDRTKDWADLEAMVEAGSLDLDRVIGVLVRALGTDDHRVDRMARLADPPAAG